MGRRLYEPVELRYGLRRSALDDRSGEMMATFQENQVVELVEDVIEDGVAMTRGARGTIVDVYSKPDEAYEVEFINQDGDVIAQFTLSSRQIRPHYVVNKSPAG